MADEFDRFSDSDCRTLLACMKKALLLNQPKAQYIPRFLFKYIEELYKFSKGRKGKIGDLSHVFTDRWDLVKKMEAENMSQSSVKRWMPQSASLPTMSNDVQAVLAVLSNVLQRFIGEAAPPDKSAKNKNGKKSTSEEPQGNKSSATSEGSRRKNRKRKKNGKKQKKEDETKIPTPYRPKDGYLHDPELSSHKGSTWSLASNHSDRTNTQSIFSVVSSRSSSQDELETILHLNV